MEKKWTYSQADRTCGKINSTRLAKDNPFDQPRSYFDGSIVLSTYTLAVTEKIPRITIGCEAATPSLNISTLKDEKTLEIHCKNYVFSKIAMQICSVVPETRVVLGGSLNISDIQENSDVYFECL